MAPRTFGATKFRNAVPSIPPREEWYRTYLPSSASAPANTTAYSGVVKTTREAVVTLTPGGDASVRSYTATGEHEGDVWSGKLGPVADWDVSRLEDGGMLVAGNDGTVSDRWKGKAINMMDMELQESRTRHHHCPGHCTDTRLRTTPSLALRPTRDTPFRLEAKRAACLCTRRRLASRLPQRTWCQSMTSPPRRHR